MLRTNTTRRHSFGDSGAIYALPSPPYSTPIVHITVPTGSTWTSGFHWHEIHTEFLKVVKGTVAVTLGATTKNFSATDGVITVPRFARHEWRRAQPIEDGVDLVVEEWTDPADGEKEQFFRNISSVVLDNTKTGPPSEPWLGLQLFVIFAGLDNYPVFYSGPACLSVFSSSIEWAVTHLVLRLSAIIGSLMGLRAIYPEYTPLQVLRTKEGVKDA